MALTQRRDVLPVVIQGIVIDVRPFDPAATSTDVL